MSSITFNPKSPKSGMKAISSKTHHHFDLLGFICLHANYLKSNNLILWTCLNVRSLGDKKKNVLFKKCNIINGHEFCELTPR
jgi:hypothetical protein